MHARSICLAPRLAEQSLQHLHLWSGGSAQLQLATKDGWSNITSQPQLGSDKLLLRMGEALIPLFLPANISTANIHIENTLVDSAIIFLNDQPWVGLANQQLPIRYKEIFQCTFTRLIKTP